MSLNTLIKSLRSKPYETRVKILWTTSAVCALILLFVWIGLAKKQSGANTPKQNPISYLQGLMENTKDQLTQFQSSSKDASEQVKITATGFSTDQINKTLVLNFRIKNDSDDILNFWNPADPQIVVAYAKSQTTVKNITTDGKQIFPQRILSKSEVSVQMVFPLSEISVVKIQVNNLSFLQNSTKIFSKTLTLDLTSRQIRGLYEEPLPRQ